MLQRIDLHGAQFYCAPKCRHAAPATYMGATLNSWRPGCCLPDVEHSTAASGSMLAATRVLFSLRATLAARRVATGRLHCLGSKLRICIYNIAAPGGVPSARVGGFDGWVHTREAANIVGAKDEQGNAATQSKQFTT